MADENLPDSDPCAKQATELQRLTKYLRQWHFVNRFPLAGFNYQSHIDSMDVKETRADTTNPTGIIKRFYKCKQDKKFNCDYNVMCYFTLSEAVFYDKGFHDHEVTRHSGAKPRSKRVSKKSTYGSTAASKKKAKGATSDNSVLIDPPKFNSTPKTGFSISDLMNVAPSNESIVHPVSNASIAPNTQEPVCSPPSLKTVFLPTSDVTVAKSSKASGRPMTGFLIADLIGITPSSTSQTVDSNKENDVIPR
uniref:C2H2-type domain-containing protein n=1 Tax=Panagrellus redivivus TaxID=6233 RepID=A0A7E4VNM5_PANRE